jgi:hypothetical protein
MKQDRVKGLGWYRPFERNNNYFCHLYICNAISRIAGGDPSEYKNRVSKMIKEAKDAKQIETIEGATYYYRFTKK